MYTLIKLLSRFEKFFTLREEKQYRLGSYVTDLKRSICTCNHGKHSCQPRKTFYLHLQSWKTFMSTTENTLFARAIMENIHVNHGKRSMCCHFRELSQNRWWIQLLYI